MSILRRLWRSIINPVRVSFVTFVERLGSPPVCKSRYVGRDLEGWFSSQYYYYSQ